VVEIEINCEESTCFFMGLSPADKILNQKARVAALNGLDLPGIHNTMCGICVENKKRDLALEQERLNFPQRLLKLKTFL
jgi:hypothetical protein